MPTKLAQSVLCSCARAGPQPASERGSLPSCCHMLATVIHLIPCGWLQLRVAQRLLAGAGSRSRLLLLWLRALPPPPRSCSFGPVPADLSYLIFSYLPAEEVGLHDDFTMTCAHCHVVNHRQGVFGGTHLGQHYGAFGAPPPSLLGPLETRFSPPPPAVPLYQCPMDQLPMGAVEGLRTKRGPAGDGAGGAELRPALHHREDSHVRAYPAGGVVPRAGHHPRQHG